MQATAVKNMKKRVSALERNTSDLIKRERTKI